MSSDTDDEDLKAAIALSLNESKAGSADPGPPAVSGVAPSADTATILASLNRKEMEAQRLARLARKRERSISPPPASSARKAPKLEQTTISLPSGARLSSFSANVQQDQRGRKAEIVNISNQRMKEPLPSSYAIKPEAIEETKSQAQLIPNNPLTYPSGAVKSTWAFGFDRTGNDIKLEEVLEPLTLRTAVLSAFQWDVEWLLAKINLNTTKLLFIMQAETEELRERMLSETETMRSCLRLCFPPMYAPIHCMHSKLMLLFHPHKLRIAIPTANLLNFDWGETGVMENSVWMIDLPRNEAGVKAEITPFANELIYFLRRQRVDQDVRDGLLNFDFSATKDMRFVHTTGGTHYDDEAQRTGLLGLASAVRQLGLHAKDDLQMDFAASSIGSLNDEYLRTVQSAARGEDLMRIKEAAVSKARANFFRSTPKPSKPLTNIRDLFRIYFPTHDTVTSSKAQAAGTICLNRKWFEGAAFPRNTFRDYRSRRSGLLSHNKILYARGKGSTSDTSKAVAWAYIGSANMSESAWGKLVQDKKDKTWKLSCRNWECGVLLPVSAEVLAAQEAVETKKQTIKKEVADGEDSETESEDETPSSGLSQDPVDMSVFDEVAQPPFEIPGAAYGDQEPWYFSEHEP